MGCYVPGFDEDDAVSESGGERAGEQLL